MESNELEWTTELPTKHKELETHPFTHDDYYDCECEVNYIHPKGVICPVCKADEEEQPDSMWSELVELGIIGAEKYGIQIQADAKHVTMLLGTT